MSRINSLSPFCLHSTLRPVGSAPPGGSSVSSHSYVPDIELWTVFITFSVEQKPAAELGWAEDHWAALTCSYNLSEIMLSLCAVLVQAALCSGPSCVILSTEARSPRPLLSSGPSLPLPRLPPATLHSAHCGCGAGLQSFAKFNFTTLIWNHRKNYLNLGHLRTRKMIFASQIACCREAVPCQVNSV